jgi:hypothetical protein
MLESRCYCYCVRSHASTRTQTPHTRAVTSAGDERVAVCTRARGLLSSVHTRAWTSDKLPWSHNTTQSNLRGRTSHARAQGRRRRHLERPPGALHRRADQGAAAGRGCSSSSGSRSRSGRGRGSGCGRQRQCRRAGGARRSLGVCTCGGGSTCQGRAAKAEEGLLRARGGERGRGGPRPGRHGRRPRVVGRGRSRGGGGLGSCRTTANSEIILLCCIYVHCS